MAQDAIAGRLWPLWGVAAGELGYVGHLFTIAAPTDEQRRSGPAVVDALNQSAYHLGVVAGLAAVFCLLIFAAGWQCWSAGTAPTSLAARVVTLCLVASAGAMLLGYGFKGALAVYLPVASITATFPARASTRCS
jgi:hypothetical protein